MGGLVELVRERRERERTRAKADALARGVREYTPEPPYERPAYPKMSPDARRLIHDLAGRMVERMESAPKAQSKPRRPQPTGPSAKAALQGHSALELAKRQAAGIEALEALLRDGFERLVEYEQAADARTSFMLRVAVVSAGLTAVSTLAAVAAIFI